MLILLDPYDSQSCGSPQIEQLHGVLVREHSEPVPIGVQLGAKTSTLAPFPFICLGKSILQLLLLHLKRVQSSQHDTAHAHVDLRKQIRRHEAPDS